MSNMKAMITHSIFDAGFGADSAQSTALCMTGVFQNLIYTLQLKSTHIVRYAADSLFFNMSFLTESVSKYVADLFYGIFSLFVNIMG